MAKVVEEVGKHRAHQRVLYRTEQTMAMFQLASRLGFHLSVFLALLEIATWFGNRTIAGRVMDELALGCTAALLLLSTLGMRLILSWMDRLAKKEELPW